MGKTRYFQALYDCTEGNGLGYILSAANAMGRNDKLACACVSIEQQEQTPVQVSPFLPAAKGDGQYP